MKYLCVHGHFSLPPREDPFTCGLVREPGAAPFRNLYEQVTADCYRPNAVLGNFDLMSFDFTPGLLCWLESSDAATFSRIRAADRGNALATTFDHVILPLLSRRDKVTQVAWGLKAFEYQFGRRARGLWLPDMAVDNETLGVIAACDVDFTVLSSEQVEGGVPDSAGPYRVALNKGQRLSVFLRDRALSDKIAFELNWLGGAGMFSARHLVTRTADGLLLLATGGESYGHYYAGEEMFLRFLLQQEAASAGYQIVPLAGFLRDHPPEREVRVVSPSSWSCEHGVERWQRECGCASPAAWKAPLRAALVHLAGAVDAIYEREARAAGLDPWAVRDGYIDVIMNRIPDLLHLAGCAPCALTSQAQDRILTLLRAQAHRLAMFTSYAFYGTDFTTLEVRHVIAHAAQVVSLVAQATGDDLTASVRSDLAVATDPRGERTATEIYTEIVEAQAQA